MNLVWKNAPYQGNTLLTLLALADWSNDDGISWPSVTKIAAKSRQSERNCQETMATLKADGIISTDERPGTSSIIKINISKLEGCSVCVGAKKSNRGGKRVQSLHPGVQTTANLGAVFAPNTSLSVNEPSVIQEPSVFAKAYQAYPRHIGVRPAEKAWYKALKRHSSTEDDLYQRVMAYALTCRHKDKQFIPHMATWLNQDRFTDDPTEWVVENGQQTSKAERRNARISETTRRVLDPAKHIPGYATKSLPDGDT